MTNIYHLWTYLCRYRSDWHNLTSRKVLPWHRISRENCLGTFGEIQLETQASTWLELPDDVRTEQRNLLCSTWGWSPDGKGWTLIFHILKIFIFFPEFHINYQTFCSWKNCRKDGLVCYRLWPVGIYREDVQVCGPAVAGQLPPHVLQWPTWGVCVILTSALSRWMCTVQ